jgi:HAD superfamily hydrolase (TIGR01484 family)
VVANVIDARARGAEVRGRTKLVGALRERSIEPPFWRVTLRDARGNDSQVSALTLVNAAGPWVKEVRDLVNGVPSAEKVRHIKGSHIVVPRVHAEEHAYILQNVDQRVVFVIPYEDRYSLIGTTDVPVEAFERPAITSAEITYLLTLANNYLARPLTGADIVWTFSGIRPLYDDGASDPSAITRDYVFKLDAADGRDAPVLSVYGGKITTYRKLAEQALSELARFLPAHKMAWTERPALPGGDLPKGGLAQWLSELQRRYPALPAPMLRGLARRRHGTRAGDPGEANPGTWARISATASPPPRSNTSCATKGARDADDAVARTVGRARRGRARAGRGPSRESACSNGTIRATAVMQPLARMPPAARRSIRGVFTDIDDTLSTHGKLTATAYGAMERLRAAGKLVIPITGRPAGWCDHIARMWPVDAVVGENGALYMRHDGATRKLVRRFAVDAATRHANRVQLAAIGAEIIAAVPGCALASDQHYRESDLAIDFREDVAELPRVAVDRIVALMQARGADGESELDPRQRRVRRLRQAGDDAHGARGSVRHRSRRRARAVRVRRRFPERRADVRVLSERRGCRQRAGSGRSHRRAAGVRHAGRGRGGVRGGRGVPARPIIGDRPRLLAQRGRRAPQGRLPINVVCPRLWVGNPLGLAGHLPHRLRAPRGLRLLDPLLARRHEVPDDEPRPVERRAAMTNRAPCGATMSRPDLPRGPERAAAARAVDREHDRRCRRSLGVARERRQVQRAPLPRRRRWSVYECRHWRAAPNSDRSAPR